VGTKLGGFLDSVAPGAWLDMAVYCGVVSVIVRSSTIEARFPGGVSAYGLSRPNETYCADGEIIRVGFLAEGDARFFIARLLEAGIMPPGSEVSSEISLIVEGVGFRHPCDWLQLGLFDGRPAAWLAGSDRGKLAISAWEIEPSATRLQCHTAEELRESYEALGIKDGLDTYRHKKTGELIYVGRPFHVAPKRRWWQFRKPSQAQVNPDNPDQIYKAASDLIRPYLEHQLENAPLDNAARERLKRGRDMLSRVLEFNPRYWAALWFRGTAHKCLRELEPAYDDFRRAYALEKTNPNVGRELACMCMALGKGEEAVQVSREVLEKNPSGADLMSNFALALLVAGDVSQAEAVVENSLKLDPTDKITRNLAKMITSVRAGQTARPDRWPRPSARR
jgi:tetratricopeptide (TPR) repeat protein